jgi:tetratricopeptide (TPR) repeat protein
MALAEIAAERGDFVTAERVFRATQEEARRQIGSRKPVFRMNQKLGDLYFRQARWPEAQREFEEALRGYRSILQEDHPDTLAVASRLGQTLAAQGRQPEAEPLLREACEGRRRQFGAENDWTQESCSALAGL